MYKFEEKWVMYGEDIIPKSNFWYIELLDDMHEYKITLKNKHNDIIEIIFDGPIDLICAADESKRIRTWSEVRLKYGSSFFGRHFLHKVTNSNILKWVMAESCGLYKEEDYKHFCILTDDDLLDIVVRYEPKMKLYKLTETSTEENEEENK